MFKGRWVSGVTAGGCMNNEGISTMCAPGYPITSARVSCDNRCLFVCQQNSQKNSEPILMKLA